ncbi:MAG TPA: hypothetical protein VHF69_07980 [Candidatus Synoicihabitans sp.]|nr:hypothetical protein [Candidatus Synoicihabitans sp.]
MSLSSLPLGFILCWVVFCTQLGLGYHITAGCIKGVFPRRDVRLMPIVMLTIAGVLAYTLRTALVFAPEIQEMRTEAGLYVACLGQILGIFIASLVHRRKLIELALEEREMTAAC